MESGDDLNRLRRPKPKERPSGIEQQIADLRRQIQELERNRSEQTALVAFLALDATSRQARLDALNATLPPDDRYSLQDYVEELRQAEREPSITQLRLEAAKSKLAELQKSSADTQ
jgi:chromosome segregation ATPase